MLINNDENDGEEGDEMKENKNILKRVIDKDNKNNKTQEKTVKRKLVKLK